MLGASHSRARYSRMKTVTQTRSRIVSSKPKRSPIHGTVSITEPVTLMRINRTMAMSKPRAANPLPPRSRISNSFARPESGVEAAAGLPSPRGGQASATACLIAASAASALPPSGPPACAMSGRPPPPLPPSAAEPTRTRSTALKRSVRSSVTPTTTPPCRLSVLPTIATTPEPTLFLPSSASAYQSLARRRRPCGRADFSAGDRRPRSRPPSPRRRPAPASCALGELALELLALVDQRLDARRRPPPAAPCTQRGDRLQPLAPARAR